MRNTTEYQLAGPKTFRRASRMLFGWQGSNLQNQTKYLRSMYESDGYDSNDNKMTVKLRYWLETGDLSLFTEEELSTVRVFLQTDQSGAEALIVAYDCDAGDYRKLFIFKIKPHTYVALKLFPSQWKAEALAHNLSIGDSDIDELYNTSIENLSKNPAWKELSLLISLSDNWSAEKRYYYLAKQTVHSANYDIQAPRFRMNILEKSEGVIVISMEQAEYFLDTYRSLFPEIPRRNQRVQQQVEQTGIIYNQFGFPFRVTNYNMGNEDMKKLYAWGPQSTIGEITRIAVSRFQEWIESNSAPFDILVDCHDSYLVQCPLQYVKLCKEKMEEFMNQKLKSFIDGTEYRMRSETNVGFNWGTRKKGVNDLGLDKLVEGMLN